MRSLHTCEKKKTQALRIFKILGASRRGPALTVETEKNATHVLRTLMVTSQEYAAWLVGLQDARPEHGTGALRIKAGGRANKDMVMVVATPQTISLRWTRMSLDRY